MTITKLTRTDLAPDLEAYQALFAQAELSHPAPSLSGDLQPRLFYGLEQLLYTPAVSSFMLVKAPEEPEYLQWLAAETRTLHEPAAPLYGVRYEVTDAQVTLAPAQSAEDNFASTAPVVMADWVEAEQLLAAYASLTVQSPSSLGWSIKPTAACLCFRYVHCWRNRCCGCV